MFIGLIMAGDGEIDMCVGPFDTYDEAKETIKAMYDEAFDPTFDRWYVTGVDTVANGWKDVKEMKEADDEI